MVVVNGLTFNKLPYFFGLLGKWFNSLTFLGELLFCSFTGSRFSSSSSLFSSSFSSFYRMLSSSPTSGYLLHSGLRLGKSKKYHSFKFPTICCSWSDVHYVYWKSGNRTTCQSTQWIGIVWQKCGTPDDRQWPKASHLYSEQLSTRADQQSITKNHLPTAGYKQTVYCLHVYQQSWKPLQSSWTPELFKPD